MVDLRRRFGVSSRRTLDSVLLAHELIRFAQMASTPAPDPCVTQVSAVVWEFAAQHYQDSGAEQFGIDQAGLAEILGGIVKQADGIAGAAGAKIFLASLRLDELVLARACAAGHNRAWEVFLNRYRATLYESAYKIAKEESAARELAAAALQASLLPGTRLFARLASYRGSAGIHQSLP